MTHLTRAAMALAFVGVATSMAAAALYPSVLTAPGSVSVKPDDDFLIGAPANPTTGYTWSVSVSDPKVLGFKGSAYQRPASATLGAGGQTVFAFEAAHAGVATITLSYRRAWEKNLKAVRTMRFTVTVTP